MRYAFAVGFFILVFLTRLAIEPTLRDHSPFLLFTLAVIASAIRGGFGPGVLATVLSAMGGLYFSPPGHAFAIAPGYKETTIFQMALFMVAGGAMSWLGGELRKTLWRVHDQARQREEMIESISAGFAAFDAKGRCLYTNRNGERLTGTRQIFLDESVALPDKIRSILAKRIPADFELWCEATNRWLEFHASPAPRGGLILLFDDISRNRTSDEVLRTTAARGNIAVQNPHVLTGLLHICANCKKIRDTEGKWRQIESYITEHSEAEFSHGICSSCAEELYPGISKSQS